MKTALVFSATEDHKPGALAKCLTVFSMRNIDITKVESRPVPAEILISSGLDQQVPSSFVTDGSLIKEESAHCGK